MSADAIVNHYRKHATTWADARGDHLGESAWLDRFRALLPLQATVLDIGCGSGLPIARYLTTQGCTITGVDSSPELIALFAQNLPNADAHVADMRELDLGRRFNGAIAWDSFFHLAPDDQRRMFAIFAEHVASNGVLMFTSGPEAGEAIGEFGGDPLYHASLAPEEYRALLANNGFSVVAHVANDADCGGHTVWLARRTN